MSADVGIQDTADRHNLRLLILLRWFAVGGQLATICVVGFAMDVRLPLIPMFGVLWFLVALNGLAWLRLRGASAITGRELFLGLLGDVLALTAQLYMSGGATNPFISLFLLQAMLGAVLLDLRRAATLAVVTIAAFLALTLWFEPLRLPPRADGDLFALHIQGMFICFVLTTVLLLVFVTRITRNLRDRDRRLAELKQQSVEEDHIVRMGLLAAGAAHELGTPLATLSVILRDWRRLPFFRRNTEAKQELGVMEAELERCKSIVRGILISSGELRGEGVIRSEARQFIDDCVQEWRKARTPPRLDYRNAFPACTRMLADVALKQVIFNLLENALEASPDWIGVEARRDGERLLFLVSDRGPGFAPEVLANLGKPYASTKSGPGRGLGLFLVMNVARKLGGAVTAVNRPQGGAQVTLALPLADVDPEPDAP
ncbi:ATP-binding protein [Brevundimonas sp. VNH65]|uniref:ATP-binding protein n=1 Tax=Brevundimonas sp. VNH65 TaxID=3400917 RepID=UPI003BFCD9A5